MKWKWENYDDHFRCCTLEDGERSLVYHKAAWEVPKKARVLISAAPEMLAQLKRIHKLQPDAELAALIARAEGRE